MYTQCPQCQTFFQVTAEHLKIAHGNVRCGQCRNVFSALGNLSEQLPDADNYQPNTNRFDSHLNSEEDIETDFLSDEELEELEDFDTNIYDEEDDFFNTYTTPAPSHEQGNSNTAVDLDGGAEAEDTSLSKAIAAINDLNKRSEAKLQKLNEGKKAIEDQYGDKLAEAMGQTAPVKPVTSKKKAAKKKAAKKTKATPAEKTKAAAKRKPSPAATPARKRSSIKNPQKSAQQTQEVPVQRSEPVINLDEAIQAIDELDINDESADFVASVAEEYAEQTTPEPAAKKKAPKKKQPGKKQLQALKKKKAALAKLAKARKQKELAIKKEQDVPVESINPDIIPVLPAILKEDFEKAAAGPRQISRKSMILASGSIVLILVFLFQTIYFKHDQLAQVGSLRPWIEGFCKLARCEVALLFDKNKLELMSQDIRTHPKVKKALLVSTTIINNATYTQAYPGLQITFSDLNGQKIAMRKFLPSEYLPPEKPIKNGMPSDTPVTIEIELMDPGEGAVNFEFAFFRAS